MPTKPVKSLRTELRVEPVRNAVPGGPDPELLTVTLTGAEVSVPPAPSDATVFRVCEPFINAVVSSVMVKGDAVTGLPELAPSTCSCTLATEPAVATVTATLLPEMVAPAAGDVIDTEMEGVLVVYLKLTGP
jgi:hypothetical protein